MQEYVLGEYSKPLIEPKRITIASWIYSSAEGYEKNNGLIVLTELQ